MRALPIIDRRGLEANRAPQNLHQYVPAPHADAPPSEDNAECYACLAPATEEIQDRNGWLPVCGGCADLES